ncbi:MAG: class I SAM-dependent methyltransferase, partial [Spirochaetia bacterium]
MSTSDVYDSYWKEGGHLTQEWTEEFFQESYGPVIRMKKVLDYGCGMGYSYQNLLIRTAEGYVGADISSVAVENTRTKGVSAVAIQENGTVPLPDDSFEGAVCAEVFEHLWDPLASARELHRILKPGGVLVATVPN